LLLWSLRNFSFFGLDAGIPPPWRQVTHYSLTFLFLVGLAWFAASWTGLGARRPRLYAAVAASAVGWAILTGLSGDNARVFHWLFPVETALSAILVALALAQFSRYAARGGWSRAYEALLFQLCLTAVGVDALDDRFDLSIPFAPQWPLTFYAAPVCGLLLALGSCTILVGQSQRARSMLESLNRLLDRRLAEQALALNEAHQQAAEAAREHAVMTERARLMRDMHDGLGGQLVSLLMRFRSGKVSAEEAASEVSRALDDLRLIVTSLDHADEAIGIALGGLRERFEPRLRDAGLQLDWQIDSEAAKHRLSVEQMLDLLRIVQEALGNCLRHAQAQRFGLKLSQTPVGSLRVQLSDDGRGIDPQAPAGKGLSNMRLRAARLGGALDVSSGATGTCIDLQLPPAEPPAGGISGSETATQDD
ncbi:MAG: histidine kinase, partial [Lysobacterales bacterium]